MDYTLGSLFIPAFIAGMLTFLAPCTLPLVPGYLGLISGSSLNDLKDPAKARSVRWNVFLNGLFFILGFSLIFIILGTVVAFVSSSLLAPYRLWLASIGGIFVMLFGLIMMEAIHIPFLSFGGGFKASSTEDRGKPLSSFVVGSAFAFGWTPCVGPILGSVLFLASASGTVFQGAFLLFIFSLGLAIPFLLIAIGIGSASRSISRYLNFISRFRVAIFAVFGFILGGLLNPLLIRQGAVGLPLRIGTIDTGLSLGILPQTFPGYILPIAAAILLGYIGSRFLKEVDAVSAVGGLFFVYLGILLLTNNVGILISYGYEALQFIEYEALLDYL